MVQVRARPTTPGADADGADEADDEAQAAVEREEPRAVDRVRAWMAHSRVGLPAAATCAAAGSGA